MKQKQRFTLIEILTVIAVIGILAGCIFPALLAVQNNSRRTKTETILTGVNTALRVFKGDYNLLPTLGGRVPLQVGEWNGNIDSMKPSDNYYTFFDILTYKNHKGRGSGINNVTSDVSEVNTKAKQYLDPPKEYFSSDETRNSVRDGWNRPIIVFLDEDADGVVTIEDPKYKKDNEGAYAGDSVAMSMGNQEKEKASQADKGLYIVIK